MSRVAALARHRNPLAVVRRAEVAAGAAEARFQLAVLDAIDPAGEPVEDRERLAEWRRALRAHAERGASLKF